MDDNNAPTPETQPEIKTPKKSKQYKLSNDKNEEYEIKLDIKDKLLNFTSKPSSTPTKLFTSKCSYEDLIKNPYLGCFENLEDITEEISDIIENKNCSLSNDSNKLTLTLHTPNKKLKDIVIDLTEEERTVNQKIDDILILFNELKEKSSLGNTGDSNPKIQTLENDMNDIKNEIGNLNEKISTLEENYDNLKKEVDEILNNFKHQNVSNNNNNNKESANNKENNNNNDSNNKKEPEKNQENEKNSEHKNISDFSIKNTIMNHQDKVMSIKVLRDGRLISSSYDKLINIYDEKSYKLVLSIKEHTGWVFYVEEIDYRIIASCSNDYKIKIYKLLPDNKYNLMQTLAEHSYGVYKIIKLSNHQLASCSHDGYIKIWQKSGSKYNVISDMKIYNTSVNNIIQTKINEIVSLDSEHSGTIRFWNIVTKLEISSFKTGNGNMLYNVGNYGYRPNNNFLLINNDILLLAQKKHIHVIDVNKRCVVNKINLNGDTNFCINKFDENNFLIGNNDGIFQYEFDGKDNSIKEIGKKLGLHSDVIWDIQKNKKGNVLTCSLDGLIHILE
jgi:WD40 repeat protein